MKSHTEYMTFETRGRRELIRITEEVQAAVDGRRPKRLVIKAMGE